MATQDVALLTPFKPLGTKVSVEYNSLLCGRHKGQGRDSPKKDIKKKQGQMSTVEG